MKELLKKIMEGLNKIVVYASSPPMSLHDRWYHGLAKELITPIETELAKPEREVVSIEEINKVLRETVGPDDGKRAQELLRNGHNWAIAKAIHALQLEESRPTSVNTVVSIEDIERVLLDVCYGQPVGSPIPAWITYATAVHKLQLPASPGRVVSKQTIKEISEAYGVLRSTILADAIHALQLAAPQSSQVSAENPKSITTVIDCLAEAKEKMESDLADSEPLNGESKEWEAGWDEAVKFYLPFIVDALGKLKGGA